MFLAKGGGGGPQRCISPPPPSLPGPFSLSAPIHVPYVGKLLPKACHLEAKHRGVVEVQQLPQGEQHRRAMSALFQALTTWGSVLSPPLAPTQPRRLTPTCSPNKLLPNRGKDPEAGWHPVAGARLPGSARPHRGTLGGLASAHIGTAAPPHAPSRPGAPAGRASTWAQDTFSIGVPPSPAFPQHTWNAGFRTRQKFRQKRAVRSHTLFSSSGLDSQRREGRVANRGWKDDPDPEFPRRGSQT